MATYNFTIRAEDESGAFSDRDFSIQIRNNLINRILIANNDDIATSPDGITFTRQIGKGGIYAGCWLKKWVVFTDPSTYRLSSDGINWFENNKLIVEGVTYSIADNIRHGTMIEYNGALYALVAHTTGKPTILRTTDLITWAMLKPTDYNTEHNTNLGINGITASIWATPAELVNQSTNLFIDDGKLSFVCSSFGTNMIWQYDSNDNSVVLKKCNLYFAFTASDSIARLNSIAKMNGLYVSIYNPQLGTIPIVRYSIGGEHSASIPIDIKSGNNSAYNERYRYNFFYHNGTFHAIFGKNYYYFKTPQYIESLHPTAPSGIYADSAVFKGRMWWIDNSYVYSLYDLSTRTGTTSHSMPAGFTTASAHSIAVLK